MQEDEDDRYQWQKTLYKKIGSRKGEGETDAPAGAPAEQSEHDAQLSVQRVLAMAKVLYGLHLVSQPLFSFRVNAYLFPK